MYFLRALLIAAVLLAPGLARAASGDGSASVEIVGPLSLSKTSDLAFGSLTLGGGTTGGTATLNPNTSALTAGGGLTAVGGTVTVGEFVAYGPTSFAMISYVPPTITLTRNGGTEQMTVNTTVGTGWTNLGAGYRFRWPPPSSGVLPLRIGGTLTVPDGTPNGTYEADFQVTVNFY
jgi:hypothetical protein